MIEVLFGLIGIILLVYAVLLCRTTILNIKNKELRRPWLFLFAFVCFFLLSYVAYVYVVRNGLSNLFFSNILVATILATAALFAVFMMKTNLTLIFKLIQKSKALENSNRELTRLTHELKGQQNQLETAKRHLEAKNMELEQTLEDFYTLRVSMGRGLNKSKITKENRKIKRRLDMLKNDRRKA
ncbi:MAG: hypothetical protein V1837_02625 [Candidatus Woesearchaeota archaeon]